MTQTKEVITKRMQQKIDSREATSVEKVKPIEIIPPVSKPNRSNKKVNSGKRAK